MSKNFNESNCSIPHPGWLKTKSGLIVIHLMFIRTKKKMMKCLVKNINVSWPLHLAMVMTQGFYINLT